jgi:hypothetical protein
MPQIGLDLSDAMEFTELLGFLIDWIDSDPAQLPRLTAPLHRQ